MHSYTSTGKLISCINLILNSLNRPDLIDYPSLNSKNPSSVLNNAFDVAEKQLGIARLLDPEGN